MASLTAIETNYLCFYGVDRLSSSIGEGDFKAIECFVLDFIHRAECQNFHIGLTPCKDFLELVLLD